MQFSSVIFQCGPTLFQVLWIESSFKWCFCFKKSLFAHIMAKSLNFESSCTNQRDWTKRYCQNCPTTLNFCHCVLQWLPYLCLGSGFFAAINSKIKLVLLILRNCHLSWKVLSFILLFRYFSSGCSQPSVGYILLFYHILRPLIKYSFVSITEIQKKGHSAHCPQSSKKEQFGPWL